MGEWTDFAEKKIPGRYKVLYVLECVSGSHTLHVALVRGGRVLEQEDITGLCIRDAHELFLLASRGTVTPCTMRNVVEDYMDGIRAES